MRGKPDYFTRQAKKEGYPARSVYKLKEIQEKSRVLRTGDRVLDIGASPGSWTKYAGKEVKTSGWIVAVDLKPLSGDLNPKNYTFIQGDVFSDAVREKIGALGPFDVLLSDAAPATTGNRTVDTGRSFSLAVSLLDLAGEMVKKGGNCVIKIFQGGEEQEVRERMRKEYIKVKSFKPRASRDESFETFLIGLEKK